ncbi:alpha-galactosidase [Vibrio cholerae]|nr:alpha-galactosidase [Vibrio cholerae]
MSHLRLANGREILVQQADIELEIAGNELFARYIGLHNRPFERRTASIRMMRQSVFTIP